MCLIAISSIYEDIISFYESISPEDIAFSKSDGTHCFVDGKEKELPQNELEESYYDALFENEAPYINSDKINPDNFRSSLKRYLTKNFSYLMKNVLYVDLKQFEAKGSYFIYEKDAPIIISILIRSISHNEKDLIIGKWLKGKVADNSYYEINELSQRLFYIIKETPANEEIKEQWIEALKCALRSDMAYTIIEVEATIKDIFCNSLPFQTDLNDDSQISYNNHSQIMNSLINYTNAIDEQVQGSIFKKVYQYLETTDVDVIIKNNDIPPVELLSLKSVCEYICSHPILAKDFPNNDKLRRIIAYFKSVDKDFLNKLKNRKTNDRQRYQRKKFK